MKMKMFAVYDSKAECFDKPFFMKTKGEAIRGWAEVANDLQTSIGKFPADFTLFEIADVDVANGIIVPHESKISLGTALEHKKQEEQKVISLQK